MRIVYMFNFGGNNRALEQALAQKEEELSLFKNTFNAISRSMAVIEFEPNGKIITANDNFLTASGYRLDEIVGQHHKIFCPKELVNSSEYQVFWQDLNNGDFLNGQFEYISKSGETIWLEANYSPVYDTNGKLNKIVKIASNITQRVEQAQQQESVNNAISKAMATIEFETSGQIITANSNFLAVTGYSLDQIQGKHHKILCEDSLVRSPEYDQMWRDLINGEVVSGQFKRVDSSGNTLWLEATYTPVLDTKGNLIKIVKFASDITTRMQLAKETRGAASASSQDADQSAQHGTEIVANALALMNKLTIDINKASESIVALNKQSDQINNIVSTISGIAEQTNLLALNAAIEAARAGEQGRGFAVVADEVRQLAGRTSDSTTEIAGVVQENVSLSADATQSMEKSSVRVNEGVELIEELNETIANINAQVGSIVEVVERLN